MSVGGISAIETEKFNIGSWVTVDKNCVFMTRSFYSYAYIRDAFFSYIHGLYFASIMASYATIEATVYYLGEHYRFEKEFIRAFGKKIRRKLEENKPLDEISVATLAKVLNKLGILDEDFLDDFSIVSKVRQNIAHCKLFGYDCRDFNKAFDIMSHINEPRFRVGKRDSKLVEDECKKCLVKAQQFLIWAFNEYHPSDCGPWHVG